MTSQGVWTHNLNVSMNSYYIVSRSLAECLEWHREGQYFQLGCANNRKQAKHWVPMNTVALTECGRSPDSLAENWLKLSFTLPHRPSRTLSGLPGSWVQTHTHMSDLRSTGVHQGCNTLPACLVFNHSTHY